MGSYRLFLNVLATVLPLLVPRWTQAEESPAQPPMKAQAPLSTAAAAITSTAEQRALRASALLQVDGVVFNQSSVDQLDPGSDMPLNEDRFLVRRARVQVDGRRDYARGMVQIEGSTLAGPSVRLLGAELSLGYPAEKPWVEATFGLMFIPFGLETPEPNPARMFLEASTWVAALFPGQRDLGARVQGSWLFLRYAVAIMNGNPSLGSTLPLMDPNRAKDLVGRLGAEGELAPWVTAAAGISALTGRGFHRGARPTKDSTVVRDANEDGIIQPSEIQRIPGDPGEPSRNFDRFALGGDLTLAYELPLLGNGSIYGEVAWAQNLDRALFVADPVAQGRNLRELGGMLAFRQLVTHHAEVGVRYDEYRPDRDARDRQGARIVAYDARFATLTATVAWCGLSQFRMIMQYEHQSNPLGRSRSGAPTTLASDALTLRAQLEL